MSDLYQYRHTIATFPFKAYVNEKEYLCLYFWLCINYIIWWEWIVDTDHNIFYVLTLNGNFDKLSNTEFTQTQLKSGLTAPHYKL